MKSRWLIFLAGGCLILIISSFFFTPSEKNTQKASIPTHTSKSFFSGIIKKATPTPEPVVLITTGDVMLGRSINSQSVQQNNFTWMWEKTAETLRAADLTFINLESPFVQDCPTTNAGMIFCSDVRNIEGLIFAGIDIANLANNHINNYGQEGVQTTTKLLNGADITPVGIGVPVYKSLKGIKFAFLGYNALERLPDIALEIKQAKNNADIVVVSFHWGNEYIDKPTKHQQELAHLAVDSGADLIIGHHPHWVQPTETYKDKLIVYSLGNFIFDQPWSQQTRQGIIGKFTFLENKLVDYEFLPIEISLTGQPSLK